MTATHAELKTTTAGTAEHSPALQVALAYFKAWTSKDLDTAMSYIAEDIVCQAPAGRLEGAEAYRAFMEPFTQILLDARIIAAFGDDSTALIMYDTRTVPVRRRSRRRMRQGQRRQNHRQPLSLRSRAVSSRTRRRHTGLNSGSRRTRACSPRQ